MLTARCTDHCGYRLDIGYGEVHCGNCHDRPDGWATCCDRPDDWMTRLDAETR